jgi:hypothetical protein
MIYQVKDIKDDIKDFVKSEEFNNVAREVEYLKKDLSKLCTKEELITRLNVFNSDVNVKLQERPTISYLKKVLSAYDVKIE